MNKRIVIALSASSLLSFAAFGCDQASSPPPANASAYQGPRPPMPPQAPALPNRPGSSLPTGWIWPFNPNNAQSVFSFLTNVRPIDASRLAPYQGTSACAPLQVAPGVWFAPDCGIADKMRMALSPAVSQKNLAGSTTALPPMVDLRAKGLDGPIKYQQMVGVCWSFAISTVMDNAVRRAGRQDVVAPMHVLASGMWNELWQKGKSDRKITLEPAWPYDPVKACKLNESQSEVWCEQAYHVQHGSWRSDPSLVAEVDQANKTGIFNVTKVEQLSAGDADQLAAVLAQDQAVYVSFQYNQNAWGSIGNSSAEIPDYAQEEGGHAVAIVGYRYVGQVRQFLIHNSWSSDWRDHGYAWISDAMVRAHAKDAFTLEVNASGTSPVPTPVPTPVATSTLPTWPIPITLPGWGTPVTPSSTDCPAGQTRDMVFATCTPTCAGGSPSVAGFCPSAASTPGNQGTQTNPPTSGCPAGQVIDWITRTCVPQCKNGLPPIGGQCLP